MHQIASVLGVCASLVSLPVLGQTFSANSQIFNPPIAAASEITALSLADYNGDGRLDFYYPGALYKQEANGSFTEVLAASGIDFEGDAPRGAILGDANLDGLLDLFILDSAPGSRIFLNRTGGNFDLGNFTTGIQLVLPPVGGFWRDLNSDGWLDFVSAYTVGTNSVLTGFANGQYSEQASFFNFRTGNRTCSLAPADYDRDGDVDVFAAACTAPNELLNQTRGFSRPRFTDRAATARVANTQSSKEAAWFDYDNDGWMDLIVDNVNDGDFSTAFNLLYHNEQDGRFVEVAEQAGIQGAKGPAGNGPLVVADFDNDGWQDVYLPANNIGKLYHNNQNGTFSEVFSTTTGLFLAPSVAAAGDFNSDGWMDLFLPGEGILFNDGGSNNWLTIEVKDDLQNRFGVGATLRLTTSAGIQTRVIEAGNGGLGHGDQLKAHFGLGTDLNSSSLEIEWPGGSKEVYTNLEANRNYVFVRGLGPNQPPAAFSQTSPVVAGYIDPLAESIRFEWEPSVDSDPVVYTLSVSGPGVSLSFPDIPDPFFELSTALLPVNQTFHWSVRATDSHSVRYSGEERLFIFGQAGTAVSTIIAPIEVNFDLPSLSNGIVRFADIDGDQDLDLLIGGDGPLSEVMSLYVTDDREIALPDNAGSYIYKSLVRTRIILEAVTYPKAAFGDVDGDIKLDLIISGISSISKLPLTALYRNTGTDMERSLVAGMPNVWGGAVEWGDMDGDGDDDLLVAGAQNLEAPYDPVTSVFVNNGNGGFLFGQFALPGIVFGDVDWSDMDGDGDLDIALTGDLGDGNLYSGVFRNDGGQFTDIHAGLPPLLNGSVAWGDFDQDGDKDLFLTGGKIGPEVLHGQAILFVNQNGIFERHPFPFDGIFSGEAVWGDYENDGDLDLFIAGSSKVFGNGVGRLFRNEDGQFAAELDVDGLHNASVAFGDYNGDGDTDLVIQGRDDNGVIQTRFLINLQIRELIPGQ